MYLRLVDLDSVYLDTTFCHPKAAVIPTRVCMRTRDIIYIITIYGVIVGGVTRCCAGANRGVSDCSIRMV